MNSFQGPMRPFPGLEPYARQVALPNTGLRLHVYEAGPSDAPAVVLVHGLGDESDTWRHLIEPLSAHHRVIAPDLPGFGRSEALSGGYAVLKVVAVLLEMMEVLSLADITLIGHSLGAMIAQAIALEHFDRLRSLVLVGGTLYAPKQTLDLGTLLFLLPGVGEMLYTRLRKAPEAAYASLHAYYGDLDALPEADRTFLFQRVNERVWSDRQRRAFLSIMRHVALWLPKAQRGLADRLAHLALTTLVVFGESDKMVSPESGRALVEVQPSAEFVMIPGAGHQVQQDCPRALLRALGDDERLCIRWE